MSDRSVLEKTVYDPVLFEVHRIKEEIAAENDYDVAKMIEAARRSQEGCAERVVRRVSGVEE